MTFCTGFAVPCGYKTSDPNQGIANMLEKWSLRSCTWTITSIQKVSKYTPAEVQALGILELELCLTTTTFSTHLAMLGGYKSANATQGIVVYNRKSEVSGVCKWTINSIKKISKYTLAEVLHLSISELYLTCQNYHELEFK